MQSAAMSMVCSSRRWHSMLLSIVVDGYVHTQHCSQSVNPRVYVLCAHIKAHWPELFEGVTRYASICVTILSIPMVHQYGSVIDGSHRTESRR